MTNLLTRIRKAILQLSQQQMADVAGTSQATVSRWEKGELEPDRSQIAAILEYARGKGILLCPSDFFGVSDICGQDQSTPHDPIPPSGEDNEDAPTEDAGEEAA
jgi:transcriptional regulator with XRE-family HTH domain